MMVDELELCIIPYTDRHRVMMSENPSNQAAHEPETPAMLKPRGGIRVELEYRFSKGTLKGCISVSLTLNHQLSCRKSLTSSLNSLRSQSHRSTDRTVD